MFQTKDEQTRKRGYEMKLRFCAMLAGLLLSASACAEGYYYPPAYAYQQGYGQPAPAYGYALAYPGRGYQERHGYGYGGRGGWEGRREHEWREHEMRERGGGWEGRGAGWR
jgi:hypothetical protein